jgi:hypothetical protein
MRAILLGVALLALAEPVIAHPKDVSPAALAAFKPGVTTYADVIATLGKPTSESFDSSGTHTIAYSMSRTHIKAPTFIPYVGLFAGGAKVDTTWETLTFDGAGVLLNYQSSSSQADCSANVFGPICRGAMPAVPASTAKAAPAS